MAAEKMNKTELIVAIDGFSQWLSGAFMDAVPVYERTHVMADYPNIRRVPAGVLRRLYDALEAFAAEAQEAENAKVLREAGRA